MTEDEDGGEALSPAAQARLDQIDIRKHRVNLERVQRCHLDIDDDPMKFDAGTIAEMIDDIASRCEDHDAFVLHGVVRALRGEDEYHQLKLVQRKRGKFVPPDQWTMLYARQRYILHRVAELEHAGIKTEAAIAEVAAETRMSRAAVFKDLKAAEESLRIGNLIFPPSDRFVNPRPHKSEKA